MERRSSWERDPRPISRAGRPTSRSPDLLDLADRLPLDLFKTDSAIAEALTTPSSVRHGGRTLAAQLLGS